jgi:hypothetical protein
MSVLIGWAVIIGVIGLAIWVAEQARGKEGGKDHSAEIFIVVFVLALFVAYSLFGDKF